MRRVLSFSLFTAAVLGFGPHPALATTITSSTFATWKTNLSGSPSEADFTKISYISYGTSSGITLPTVGNSPVSFNVTGPDGTKWTLNGVKYNTYTSLEGGSDSSATVKITLPSSGENAVLLGLASVLNAPITITLSDGETFTTSNSVYGISISHTISWLTVATTSSSQAVISDFWYGNSSIPQDTSGTGGGGATSTAPESATLLLIGGGLLVLIGAYRKLGTETPKSAV